MSFVLIGLVVFLTTALGLFKGQVDHYKREALAAKQSAEAAEELVQSLYHLAGSSAAAAIPDEGEFPPELGLYANIAKQAANDMKSQVGRDFYRRSIAFYREAVRTYYNQAPLQITKEEDLPMALDLETLDRMAASIPEPEPSRDRKFDL